MLWVYGHYKYFNSVSAETVFIRQNLTSVVDVCRRQIVPYNDGSRAGIVIDIQKNIPVLRVLSYWYGYRTIFLFHKCNPL